MKYGGFTTYRLLVPIFYVGIIRPSSHNNNYAHFDAAKLMEKVMHSGGRLLPYILRESDARIITTHIAASSRV